jgi:hypothetical protein
MTQFGRTKLTSAVMPSGVTGAYAALDAVGSAFMIPEAAGALGGVIMNVNVFDRSTGSAQLDLHLFSTAFTPAADNAPFAILPADQPNYLGSVPVTAWNSAGTNTLLACVQAPGVGIYSQNANRTIYGQFAARSACTFGGTAFPLLMTMMVLQD